MIESTSDLPFSHQGPRDGGNFEYEWSDTFLAAHVISDVGKRRDANEDSCLVCTPEDPEIRRSKGFLFAVADGMGGASAGEHASHLALSTFSKTYYADSPPTDEQAPSTPDRMRDSAERANRVVFEEAGRNPEYQGMGTTLSALSIAGDCAYVAQVGDSRIYLLRGQDLLTQITDDHSLVAEQVRSGMITAEEAENHAFKNLITRAIGIKDHVDVDLFAMRLEKGDTMMLCSDGLSGLVVDDAIADALKFPDLRSAARVLVGQALEAGGNDNVSVALVRVVSPPPQGKLQDRGTVIRRTSGGLTGWVKGLFG